MAEKETKVAAPKADAVKAVESKGEPAKAEATTESKSEAPKNYSRGEGQKPVTQAYKDNWNAIYGKKKKKKS
jgi:hypothetical protein